MKIHVNEKLKKLDSFFVLMMAFGFPSFAFAGTGTPALSNTLNMILDVVSSWYVTTIIVIALLIVVVLWISGRILFKLAIKIGIILALIHFAPTIVDTFYKN